MLREILNDNRFLLCFVTLQFCATLSLFWFMDFPGQWFHFQPVYEMMTLFVLFLVLISVLPNFFARHKLITFHSIGEVLNICLGIAAMSVSLCLFSAVKSIIYKIDPFSWDPFLYELDKFIHFGFTPQSLLEPLYHLPYFTRTVEFIYVSWIPLFYAYVCWWLLHKPGTPGRAELMISFILIWVLFGNVMALAFSSAGPVFFDLAHPDRTDPYAVERQIFYLSSGIDSLTVRLQAILADLSVRKDDQVRVTGISAFPSVHIAINTLLVVHAFYYDRPAFWWLLTTAIAVIISCLMLLWHYAVDCYSMIILVPFLFLIVRRALTVFRAHTALALGIGK